MARPNKNELIKQIQEANYPPRSSESKTRRLFRSHVIDGARVSRYLWPERASRRQTGWKHRWQYSINKYTMKNWPKFIRWNTWHQDTASIRDDILSFFCKINAKYTIQDVEHFCVAYRNVIKYTRVHLESNIEVLRTVDRTNRNILATDTSKHGQQIKNQNPWASFEFRETSRFYYSSRLECVPSSS